MTGLPALTGQPGPVEIPLPRRPSGNAHLEFPQALSGNGRALKVIGAIHGNERIDVDPAKLDDDRPGCIDEFNTAVDESPVCRGQENGH